MSREVETPPETGIRIRTEVRAPSAPAEAAATAIKLENINFGYGQNQVLHDVSMDVDEKRVTAFIGPSGCGKSTLLRCLNRMNDLIESAHLKGRVVVKGKDIYAPGTDVIGVRRRVGMVFQKSNPFPKSIFDNVVYGLRISGVRDRTTLDAAVEKSLTLAALWDEVKDRLNQSALSLSGGQQQRLCIARAIAIEPDVLLLDEPASALDPIATASIEDLMHSLKGRFTIVIVTHNMQQAARVADKTAFFSLDSRAAEPVGTLVEFADTEVIFSNPADPRTRDYVTGRFG